MTATTTATALTATTTTAPRLSWGITSRGEAVIGLGRILDEYVSAAYAAEDLGPHDLEAVQADEALSIATQAWLWQGILQASLPADLDELAWACDEQARDRQDGGHGWAAEVWEDVSRYIRRLPSVA